MKELAHSVIAQEGAEAIGVAILMSGGPGTICGLRALAACANFSPPVGTRSYRLASHTPPLQPLEQERSPCPTVLCRAARGA